MLGKHLYEILYPEIKELAKLLGTEVKDVVLRVSDSKNKTMQVINSTSTRQFNHTEFNINFTTLDNHSMINFTSTYFPANCGILIVSGFCCHLFYKDATPNQAERLFPLMFKMFDRLAKHPDFSKTCIMLTDVKGDIVLKYAKKAGFEEISEFVNANSGNTVKIMVKYVDIVPEPDYEEYVEEEPYYDED